MYNEVDVHSTESLCIPSSHRVQSEQEKEDEDDDEFSVVGLKIIPLLFYFSNHSAPCSSYILHLMPMKLPVIIPSQSFAFHQFNFVVVFVVKRESDNFPWQMNEGEFSLPVHFFYFSSSYSCPSPALTECPVDDCH